MSEPLDTNPSPVAGERAPDLKLPDHTGTERWLSDSWTAAQRGCVLVFLRHFG